MPHAVAGGHSRSPYESTFLMLSNLAPSSLLFGSDQAEKGHNQPPLRLLFRTSPRRRYFHCLHMDCRLSRYDLPSPVVDNGVQFPWDAPISNTMTCSSGNYDAISAASWGLISPLLLAQQRL